MNRPELYSVKRVVGIVANRMPPYRILSEHIMSLDDVSELAPTYLNIVDARKSVDAIAATGHGTWYTKEKYGKNTVEIFIKKLED